VADDPLDRSRAYVAAGVLFFDDAGGVLLVQPPYKDHWDIPGGYVETGDTRADRCPRGPRRAKHRDPGRTLTGHRLGTTPR
jgi:8-oxo-dGTP diphosphatase